MFRDTFRLRDWVSEMPANSTIKKKKKHIVAIVWLMKSQLNLISLIN